MLRYKLRTRRVEDLIDFAQSGFQEAMDLVIEKYYPMVIKIASKYYGSWAEFSDLVQNGLLGLMKAVFYFDKEKSSFSSFAWRSIESEIKSFLTYLNRKKNLVLTEAAKIEAGFEDESDEDPSYMLSEETEEGPDETFWKEYITERLKVEMNEEEQSIVDMWSMGYSYKEISKELGVSQKKVDNTVQKIRRVLGWMIELRKSMDEVLRKK
ncbi:MAG: polymerase sporulation-specific sigma factor [Thermotogota bacterium]|nr:polymerase sporulation-specific sigma factor [Thermotogota bacterium]MDK2864390.1 polymerase sporulation-specific sigma factor [Thermotogota bacterium]HCZ05911.1 RNA polymerase subunit sigma-70 [Thermotogota bacterium]